MAAEGEFDAVGFEDFVEGGDEDCEEGCAGYDGGEGEECADDAEDPGEEGAYAGEEGEDADENYGEVGPEGDLVGDELDVWLDGFAGLELFGGWAWDLPSISQRVGMRSEQIFHCCLAIPPRTDHSSLEHYRSHSG